jgi:flagellar basal-body rod protein FlgB
MTSLTAQLASFMSLSTIRNEKLAENIANANMPGYKAKDIDEKSFFQIMKGVRMGSFSLMRTNPRHFAGESINQGAIIRKQKDAGPTKPNGNNINLAVQSLKIAKNQLEHQKATDLYKQNVDLYRMALGK